MLIDFSRPSSKSSVLEDLKKCRMHSENQVAVVKSAFWVIANLNSCYASCLTGLLNQHSLSLDDAN